MGYTTAFGSGTPIMSQYSVPTPGPVQSQATPGTQVQIATPPMPVPTPIQATVPVQAPKTTQPTAPTPTPAQTKMPFQMPTQAAPPAASPLTVTAFKDHLVRLNNLIDELDAFYRIVDEGTFNLDPTPTLPPLGNDRTIALSTLPLKTLDTNKRTALKATVISAVRDPAIASVEEIIGSAEDMAPMNTIPLNKEQLNAHLVDLTVAASIAAGIANMMIKPQQFADDLQARANRSPQGAKGKRLLELQRAAQQAANKQSGIWIQASKSIKNWLYNNLRNIATRLYEIAAAYKQVIASNLDPTFKTALMPHPVDLTKINIAELMEEADL